MLKYFLIYFSIVNCFIQCKNIQISNVKPRNDTQNRLMDIHDGNIFQVPNSSTYYFYGMGYGSCKNPSWGCAGVFGFGNCGFQLNHTVNLYTSEDLVNWTYQGDVFPAEKRPTGIYFRPKVAYDTRRKMLVLWINRVGTILGLPNYLDSHLLVAVSNSPEGPFLLQTEKVDTQHGNPGDFTIFIDEDEKGYLISDSFNTNHKVSIELLTPDYLNVDSKVPSLTVSDSNNEAPIFFKRNGWYYMLYGQCCCFCHTGSNSYLKMSKDPLGPYIDTEIDIDPYTGSFFGGKSVTKGQESFVFKANNEWVFVSDRWGSAHDGEKGHDLQYWGKLEFDDTRDPPVLKPLQWEDEWTLEI